MCVCARVCACVCLCVCAFLRFCKAAHASGLVSELIIAHLGISVRAGESNGLFILE